MLNKILDEKISLQKYIFDKGFLITDKVVGNLDVYPFYGNWSVVNYKQHYFYIHKENHFYALETSEGYFFLIGHAYNPYTMEYDENKILAEISEAYKKNEQMVIVNQLTGVFIFGIITSEQLLFLLDASGMQYGCYGMFEGHYYVSSHMRLIGDLLGLKTSEYVERLCNYKWYRYMMGNYLPGDITCYSEMKRILPNTMAVQKNGEFNIARFYPNKMLKYCSTEAEYHQVIAEAASILKNTMVLIPEKWKRPAISLTGGIDSNTTFAAANGIYTEYSAFSYVSISRESVDAEKAQEIAQRFHVDFKTYYVPEKNEDIIDFDAYKRILQYNGGDIGPVKDDDIRKKIYLIKNDVCDVEVKSWVSETIRAYAYKYFGRKKYPSRLKPRDYTSLYKIILNRQLVKETDRWFQEYLEQTDLHNSMYNYDESDLFVWEMMHGGKCGLDIGVMKSCFDITIPYNNRNLLDLLLRVPLKYRLNDQHHLDMKKLMNKELYDMNIRVVNLNETNFRKKILNTYYTINTHIPF